MQDTDKNDKNKRKKTSARRPPRFDLIAGNAALDFVNTLDDRYTQPKELLEHYSDLLRFVEDAGLLAPREADRLDKRSAREPDRAVQVLRRARELRESIHDLYWGIINRRPATAAALAKLNAEVQKAAQHLRVVPADGSFKWTFDDLDNLESPLWKIARAAADLLASDQLHFVRACSSPDCQWFFLDTSKNHHRRWCDMKRCGNRAKVRRFYAKRKTA